MKFFSKSISYCGHIHTYWGTCQNNPAQNEDSSDSQGKERFQINPNEKKKNKLKENSV